MKIIDELYNSKEFMPDIQIKEMSFGMNKVYVVNIQTVSSSIQSNDFVLNYLADRSLFKSEVISSLKHDISNYVPSISFIDIKESEVFNYLFDGFTIIIYKDEIIAMETKALLDRGVTEPTSEPTIKGPKDAFNENYNTNIGLVRRRIKDRDLHIKELVLGSKTRTRISIMYMDSLANKELLNNVINKIENIKSSKILDTYYIKD